MTNVAHTVEIHCAKSVWATAKNQQHHTVVRTDIRIQNCTICIFLNAKFSNKKVRYTRKPKCDLYMGKKLN